MPQHRPLDVEGFSTTSATPTINTTLSNMILSSSLASYTTTPTSSPSAVNASATDTIDASTTSDLPVQIANSFSLVACLAVFVSFFVLRRKYKRIMERPSLVIAVSMATTDGLLHTINLFGYENLPHNFICAFFGGFLYAFPTLTSIFYSFCIALNSQLVFVFSKRPGNSTLKYYIGLPIFVSACICVPALGVGAYGYDESYDLCWYAWNGTQSSRIFIRYFFTFGLWCLGPMLYLAIAAITIIHAVFAKSSRINQLATNLSKSLADPASTSSTGRVSKRYSELPEPYGLHSQSNYHLPRVIISQSDLGVKSEFETEPSSPMPQQTAFNRASMAYGLGSAPMPSRTQNTTLSRRSMAMRALALRLLGYILIPTVCILPGVVQDVISKTYPDTAALIPDRVTTMFDTLNGLVGLFNAILFALDPALLALYHLMKMRKGERAHPEEQIQQGVQSRHMAFEMADTRTGFSAYSTPPESPQVENNNNSNGVSQDDNKGNNNKSRLGVGNGTTVEVKKGRALSFLFNGGRGRRGFTPNSFVDTGNSTGGAGLVIRVDVEVQNDGDRDLERLERYLGGM